MFFVEVLHKPAPIKKYIKIQRQPLYNKIIKKGYAQVKIKKIVTIKKEQIKNGTTIKNKETSV